MPTILAIALALSGACANAAAEHVADATLVPDVEVRGVTLAHGESMLFELSALRSGGSYEVRVSYPAWSPAQFDLQLLTETEARNNELALERRKLLNIEKIVFQHQAEPSEIKSLSPGSFVRVTAWLTGIRSPAAQAQRADIVDSVTFNIVLQSLYLGIPLEAFKVALLALLFAVILIKWVARPLSRMLANFELSARVENEATEQKAC
ncbi:hypothetical protein CAOG_009336 [Capsaspora owczarzaki ATCC 30864]|uniref:Uncharacterized protein n=1 Tax=Capsaspora owczarzaki (strain ATCC 30864) TaxID=595528 RepID=A0A0D2VH37_CAPO3|nr:hypothetical protein CAOG_009336 [Capsaspora owczarzaki ATCC 30864]